MLRDNINKAIAVAMKSRDSNRLYVLKMIKAKFLEYRTSKGFNEEDFTDNKEISILQKMASVWQDELETFKNANRDTAEMEERLKILKTFIPTTPSDEEVAQLIKNSGVEIKPQNMKTIIQKVQMKYPAATGKQISSIIKNLN